MATTSTCSAAKAGGLRQARKEWAAPKKADATVTPIKPESPAAEKPAKDLTDPNRRLSNVEKMAIRCVLVQHVRAMDWNAATAGITELANVTPEQGEKQIALHLKCLFKKEA
jgi:hypothetical protein